MSVVVASACNSDGMWYSWLEVELKWTFAFINFFPKLHLGPTFYQQPHSSARFAQAIFSCLFRKCPNPVCVAAAWSSEAWMLLDCGCSQLHTFLLTTANILCVFSQTFCILSAALPVVYHGALRRVRVFVYVILRSITLDAWANPEWISPSGRGFMCFRGILASWALELDWHFLIPRIFLPSAPRLSISNSN